MKVSTAKTAAIVPAEILKRNDLSLNAKGLYAYVLLMADPQYVTIKGIALELRQEEKAVRYAATELEAMGYLSDVQ
ncbi:hypothetical protein AHiyo6_00330 [Arthrobacter sp. Hiyo6]|nr:hypothetical protein AHiyo6_00330 [Arthrobacter sp. Hiyo6]